MKALTFPSKCCVCMGFAETEQKISKYESFGALNKSASTIVPICRNCKKKHFSEPKIIRVSSSIFIGGLLIGILSSGDPEMGFEGGFFLGAMIGGIVSLFLLNRLSDKLPARIKLHLDWPYPDVEFDNKEYEELFRRLNLK